MSPTPTGLVGGDETTAKPETAKPETEKPKKGKGRGKGKAATSANGVKVTVESVKAQAKKIALESPDPKECMNQIREKVSETAELCYENANVGLDKFDATGLILLDEELTKFVYTPPEPESGAANADELEI